MATDKKSTDNHVDLVNTDPEYFNDLDYIDELAFALDQDNCEIVFSMSAYDDPRYDSNVYRYGKYYISQYDGFNNGPFTSLQDAIINSEFNVIYESVTSIWGDLGSDELAKILAPREELPKGFTFLVDDEPWEMSDTGKFKPKQAI